MKSAVVEAPGVGERRGGHAGDLLHGRGGSGCDTVPDVGGDARPQHATGERADPAPCARHRGHTHTHGRRCPRRPGAAPHPRQQPSARWRARPGSCVVPAGCPHSAPARSCPSRPPPRACAGCSVRVPAAPRRWSPVAVLAGPRPVLIRSRPPRGWFGTPFPACCWAPSRRFPGRLLLAPMSSSARPPGGPFRRTSDAAVPARRRAPGSGVATAPPVPASVPLQGDRIPRRPRPASSPPATVRTAAGARFGAAAGGPDTPPSPSGVVPAGHGADSRRCPLLDAVQAAGFCLPATSPGRLRPGGRRPVPGPRPPCAVPALRCARPALRPPCAAPALRCARPALRPPCAVVGGG
ncbi:hypothetical protein BX265_7094 [Streptomyces sp. TLI_235]|nr:hypothetical protein BX265_7094 [Streptomyces sp. TLI_235]